MLLRLYVMRPLLQPKNTSCGLFFLCENAPTISLRFLGTVLCALFKKNTFYVKYY